MPTQTVLLSQPPATTVDSILHRKSVWTLGDQEVLNLRKAFAAMYALSDSRGYLAYAHIHGWPQFKCNTGHHRPPFAVWHRPYLMAFEKALQELVPGVTLAYWDWSTPAHNQQGIPPIFAAETYEDGTGTQVPNPLYGGPIDAPANPNPDQNDQPIDPVPLPALRQTSREFNAQPYWPRLPAMVDRAMRETQTDRFRNALEQPHDIVHGSVGGDMGIVPTSAFDPIFWFHHANVDRLFWEWQQANPDAQPPDDLWNLVLDPFKVTTKDIWAPDPASRGYDYVEEIAMHPQLTAALAGPAPIAGGSEDMDSAPMQMRPAVTDGALLRTPVADFSLANLPANFQRADLKFEEVAHPTDPVVLRVFVNQDDASVNTPMDDNEHFAGLLPFFAHGRCLGDDEGHCDYLRPRSQFDIRGPHHLQPFTESLDITDAIRAARASGHASIKLVATDYAGRELTEPQIRLGSISLVTF